MTDNEQIKIGDSLWSNHHSRNKAEWSEFVIIDENRASWLIVTRHTADRGTDQVFDILFPHQITKVSKKDLTSKTFNGHAQYYTTQGRDDYFEATELRSKVRNVLTYGHINSLTNDQLRRITAIIDEGKESK